jgi:2',3'-cyclic-nucleotide 2'-phosphodiesterase (5'-nucleotidase family)
MIIRYLSLLLLLSFSSCTYIYYKGTKSDFYKTELFSDKSTKIDSTVAPYRLKVEDEMNIIIGSLESVLKKEQPESNLGNWACDAVKEQTESYTGKNVDFAVLNYGGLRIGSIAAGNISKGKIYELMPFDNSLLIVEMSGKDLPLLFKYMISKGGWPISSDLKIIGDKDGNIKAVSIKNLTRIDPEKIYRIATIDYLANGGDNCSFFIGKPQIETGVFLRDAIIENISKKHKTGLNINAVKDGRFIIE